LLKSVVTATACAICLLLAGGAAAGKTKTHVVEAGDSIAQIARHNGVEQETLRQVNGLDEDDVIRPGDVLTIPDVLLGGWTKSHRVKRGDTLIRIARRYRVDVDDIRELNKIGPADTLRIGQLVVIPKGERLAQSDAAGAGDGSGEPAKPKWNGKAKVVRVRDSERKTMTMFDKRGRVRTYARRTISRLARSKKGRVRWLNRRLIALLGRVAEHYPGRQIEIISGFRPHKRGKKRSQHAKGRAIDFRVRGVEDLELYEFLRTFDDVGVGYYPKSTFVHLDVRDRKFLWTDVSGPGEKAIYVKPGEAGSAESAIAQGAVVDDALIEAAEGTPDPENFPEDGLELEGEPAAGDQSE
jgi:uncharacterized protein YcbK (DUF882 family)